MRAHGRLLTWLPLLLLLLPSGAAAQMLEGRTVDAGTRKPIGGVEVALLDTAGAVRRTVVSGDSGQFMLVVDSGRYTLRGTRLGYAVAQSHAIDLHGGETFEVELRLSVQPVALEPLKVIARERSLRQRDLNQYYKRVEENKTEHWGQIFARKDLAGFDAWTYQTFMRREAPVTFASHCQPAMYWDGRAILSDEMDELMSVTNIEGIEFYPNSSGPPGTRFVDPSGCGVLLIWSRPLSANGRPFQFRTLAAAVAGFALITFLIKLAGF